MPALDAMTPQPSRAPLDRSPPRNERMAAVKIECNACPVLCQISDGKTGACDRYANRDGLLVRVDPVVLLRRTLADETGAVVPFAPRGDRGEAQPDPAWNGDLLLADEVFVTGIGSSTTYPDYKPAPFIVASQGRRCRPGDRGDGRHLQLLQLQGEDRYRSLSRTRAGQRALQGRGGRPCDHGRVRLADAVARRRPSPHRRQQEGRARHRRD